MIQNNVNMDKLGFQKVRMGGISALTKSGVISRYYFIPNRAKNNKVYFGDLLYQVKSTPQYSVLSAHC